MLRKLSLYFAAGAVGGTAYILIMWLFGAAGITQMLKVDLVYELDMELLYTGIGMGGIAGLLFILPVPSKNRLIKGITLGLVAAAIELFILMPIDADRGLSGVAKAFGGKSGILGLHLGAMTPLLIILFNQVWGLTASFWNKITGN